MRLATLCRQPDLLLSFHKARALLLVLPVAAMVTADPRRVIPVGQVLRGKRHAAGMTHVILAGLQAMIHRHTAIKDKALALPAAGLLRNLFKIFQDAALQVVNLVKPV